MLRKLAFALFALAMLPLSAAAQEFPSRAINVVVPLQAGTASDLVARVVTDSIASRHGYRFVVDNVAGAGGSIGAQRVAKAAADGYTLGMFNNGIHAILPHTNPTLPFSPEADFAPITLVAGFPSVLIIKTALPAKNLKELIELAKASPGKLNYASVGFGSPQHIAMEQLMDEAGIKMTHVPYRGGVQATQAMVAGEVDAFWIALPVALPLIHAGKIRALAVGDRTRARSLPDVPTVQEAGLPKFEYSPWLGLFARKQTPAPALEKLGVHFREALGQPDVQKRIQGMGLEVRTSSAAELAALTRRESAEMKPVIKRLGLDKL